jgi:positive phototaxis protein PixI
MTLSSSPQKRLQALLPQLFEPLNISGDSYLRFQLSPELPAFLLPMEEVQEATLVPVTAVTPIPNMPSIVLGIMNSRNHVFCLIDLPLLLNLQLLSTSLREYQVIVISLAAASSEKVSQWLGLAVPSIGGVVRFAQTQRQPLPENLPTQLRPFLTGSIVNGGNQEWVLDRAAITTSVLLIQNPFA